VAVDYYCIVYRNADTVLLVKVGKNIGDREKYEESLKRLAEAMRNIMSSREMVVKNLSELVSEAKGFTGEAVAAAFLCTIYGTEPRIVDEYWVEKNEENYAVIQLG